MNLWGKRGKFSIIADMLEVADGGAGKTQIMYRANLSFRQLEKYLRLMLEIDLLDETSNNGRKVYGATHKGINFLQRYYAIKELLKTEDDNNHKNGSEQCMHVVCTNCGFVVATRLADRGPEWREYVCMPDRHQPLRMGDFI